MTTEIEMHDRNGGAQAALEMANVPVSTVREFLRHAVEGDLMRFQEESGNLPRLDVRVESDVHYYDRTALHLAALHGQVQIVKCILSKLLSFPGPNIPFHDRVVYAQEVVNSKDRFGFTPLHLAVREKKEEVVRILTKSSWVLPDRFIAATSDVDEDNHECDGFTPLHLAARTGNIQIVKLLLRQSLYSRGEYNCFEPVNIRATTWKGDSALDLAKRGKDREVLVELLECFDPNWLQSEREKNANSMNAVLVGTALVVAATFAAWLQPPLGVDPDSVPDQNTVSYRKQSHHATMFFCLISIAFASAMLGLVIGTVSMIPFHGASLKSEVQYLRKAVQRATYFLFVALFFLTFAFQYASILVFGRVSFADDTISSVGRWIIFPLPLVTASCMGCILLEGLIRMEGQNWQETRWKILLVVLRYVATILVFGVLLFLTLRNID